VRGYLSLVVFSGISALLWS